MRGRVGIATTLLIWQHCCWLVFLSDHFARTIPGVVVDSQLDGNSEEKWCTFCQRARVKTTALMMFVSGRNKVLLSGHCFAGWQLRRKTDLLNECWKIMSLWSLWASAVHQALDSSLEKSCLSLFYEHHNTKLWHFLGFFFTQIAQLMNKNLYLCRNFQCV